MAVSAGADSWDNYFKTLDGGQKYLVDFVQKTNLQKASTEDLIKANEAARQSALNHNAALKQQTLGAKAAAVGMNLLRTALSAVALTAIITAVSAMANAIISKITDIVNAYENGVKKIKDLTDEVKSLESEQSSLNDELKKSKEHLYELQQIKMPTLFEESEIENLKEYNKQLEAEIRLKELELELKKKEANETAQQTFKNSQFDYNSIDDFTNEDFQWWEHILNTTSHGWYQRGRNALQNVTNWFEGNTWEQQEDYLKKTENSLANYEGTRQALQNYQTIIDNLDKYQEHIANSEAVTPEDIYNIFGEDILENLGVGLDDFTVFLDQMGTEGYAVKYREQLEEKINASKEKLDEYINNLTARLSDWRIELAGLDPDDQNNTERINQLNDVIARAENVINNKVRDKNFLDVYNNVDYSDVVVQLEALAKEGKLTEDTFSSVEGIENFKEALAAVGKTDIGEVVRSIINKVQKSENAFDSASESAKNYADSISEIKEKADEVLKNSDLFKSAIEKQKNGESLNYDEISSLIELDPSIAAKAQKTADGYNVAIQTLIDANKSYVGANGVQDIQDSINQTRIDISNAQNKIAQLRNKQAEIDDVENLREIDEEIDALTTTITNGEKAIKFYQLAFKELTDNISKIPSITSSDLTSGFELLNSTTEEFNNSGAISLSTLQKITDAYPKLNNAVNQYLQGIISEKELIEQLSDAYDTDRENYYKCLFVKLGYSEDYVIAAFEGEDGIVKYFADSYEIDLRNFKTYIEKKQAVQAAFDSYVAGGISAYWTEENGWTNEFLNLDDHAKSEISSFVYQYQNALEELEGFSLPDSKFKTDLQGIKDRVYNSIKTDSSSNNSSEDTKKTFNWIERAIEKVQKAFSKLGNIASNTYKALTTRNNALAGQIKTIRNEIELQQRAYAAYMAKANSVGLPSDLMEKVQNGAIDIRDYDSDTAEIINEYKEWYLKMPLYPVTGGGILFNC